MPRLTRSRPPTPPTGRHGAPRWLASTPAAARPRFCAHGVPTGRGCAECGAVHPAGPHTVDERHPAHR